MGTKEKKNICVHCGNNPVPHFLYWYNGSLAILLAPLRRVIFYNPLTVWGERLGLGRLLSLALVRILEFFRIVKKQGERERCAVPRARVLWEEAERRGIKMEELLLLGKPFDVYIAQKGIRDKDLNSKFKISNSKRLVVFSGLPRPRGYDGRILDSMDDKWLFKRLLMKHGLPVPAGTAVTSFWQAKKTFGRIQKPVIVKPRAGSRGRHSATFVRNEQDLKQAFRVAKRLCYWVMVEEQLAGPVYRATVIDFKLQGVLRGDPPQVIGDGTSDIGMLIEKKNSAPHPGVKDIKIDEQMRMFVERELGEKFQISNFKFQMDGLGPERKDVLEYVPAAGEIVDLSEKIGVNYGGCSSEDFTICHPDNKDLFVRAAKALGDPVVGFDFIIPDITRSYKEQRCGFIEANSLPFINLHHAPLLGQPRNVAAAVWDMVGW